MGAIFALPSAFSSWYVSPGKELGHSSHALGFVAAAQGTLQITWVWWSAGITVMGSQVCNRERFLTDYHTLGTAERK